MKHILKNKKYCIEKNTNQLNEIKYFVLFSSKFLFYFSKWHYFDIEGDFRTYDNALFFIEKLQKEDARKICKKEYTYF